MDRRKFLISGIKVVPFGIGFTLMPSYTQAEGVLSFLSQFQNQYTFDAWEVTFQKQVKDKQLDGAVLSKIRENYPNSNVDFSTSINTHRVVNRVKHHNVLRKKYSKLSPITPHFKAVTKNEHNIEGQSFLNSIREKTGIFKGIRKGIDGVLDYNRTAYYVVYSGFYSSVLGRKEFFCYGTPCDLPIIEYCDACGEEFASQKFYYNGNSIFDKDNTYTKKEYQLYYNMSCGAFKYRKHKQHNGYNISLSSVDPCVCDDDIIGVKNELRG